MTTTQLKRTRNIFMCIVGILTFILLTIIIRNMPEYFDECKLLTTTAKIARVISFLSIFFGVTCFAIDEDDDEVSWIIYFTIAISAFYEIVISYYYLRVRVIGYHRFISYSDCLGVLLVTLALLLIIEFCLIFNIKLRRLLFDNDTWRDKDLNNALNVMSKIGIVFSISLIVVVFFVEGFQKQMFKPTGVDNGYSYIDLKLPSGTRWATQNFFSSDINDLGAELRWGQTTNQAVANPEYYQGENPLAFLADSEDAISELMGGNWYIPTQTDFDELLSNCKIHPAYFNGVYGITFKGHKTIKRIFIPAEEFGISRYTSYWTSTVIPIPEEDEVEIDYEYTYAEEDECDTCSCVECNCCCRIVEEEITENDDWIDQFYIEAAVLTIRTMGYFPSKLVFIDQATSNNKCRIRPVTF